MPGMKWIAGIRVIDSEDDEAYRLLSQGYYDGTWRAAREGHQRPSIVQEGSTYHPDLGDRIPAVWAMSERHRMRSVATMALEATA